MVPRGTRPLSASCNNILWIIRTRLEILNSRLNLKEPPKKLIQLLIGITSTSLKWSTRLSRRQWQPRWPSHRTITRNPFLKRTCLVLNKKRTPLVTLQPCKARSRTSSTTDHRQVWRKIPQLLRRLQNRTTPQDQVKDQNNRQPCRPLFALQGIMGEPTQEVQATRLRQEQMSS